MTSLYFAYGANMHPESMRYRCPDAVPVGQFNLRDWQLEFYNHATIMPVADQQVPGVIWSITEDCEHRLDAYEGYPTYYTKRNWHQDGLDFFFYEMTASNRSGQPGRSYVANIADSYRYWNIAGDVTRALAYETYSDPEA
jgi:hypothetical protein